MKKVLVTLLLLIMMGLQNTFAQNYEIVYSMKMNPESVVRMIAGESGVPKALLSFIKDDIKNARIMVSMKYAKDQCDITLLKEKSKFEIGFMGMKMDFIEILANMGISSYSDFARDEHYIKAALDGKDYCIRTEGDPEGVYKPVNLFKKIKGHECRKMVDKKNKMTVWYAEDIPFQTKMYPGVPGLVLEISDDEGITFTAVTIKPASSAVSLPRNAKVVTKEQMRKIIKDRK